MHIVHTIAELRERLDELRCNGARVALVPTMGALHEAHLSLVDTAQRHADAVVVSIFVNPKQFAPGEDLDSYPRTLAADSELCATRGVDIVFAPAAAEMYGRGFQTEVEVTELGRSKLCAVTRPHFFGGVATVVLKLLNIAMADVAVFGEKDFQQLLVIRRMCADLNHPTAIIGSPVVREAGGLAMSSRNRYLSEDQKRRAQNIFGALVDMQKALKSGVSDVHQLVSDARVRIEAAGGLVDYVAVVDSDSLVPLASVQSPARALVAATFGGARLIDNAALQA